MTYTLDPYANETMITAFAERTNMNPTEIKHLQVAYLYHVVGEARRWIADITGYAVSTLSSMRTKALGWVDKAKELFEKGIEIVEQKIVMPRTKRQIEYYEDENYQCQRTNKPCAYIITMLGKSNEYLNLKIGKANNAEKRFAQELKNQRTYPGLDKIIVNALFPCENDDDALTMENALRKFYKNLHNGVDYVRNDRFTQAVFSPEHLKDRKIQSQYDFLME